MGVRPRLPGRAPPSLMLLVAMLLHTGGCGADVNFRPTKSRTDSDRFDLLLRSLGLEGYAGAFAAAEVGTAESLAGLTEEQLAAAGSARRAAHSTATPPLSLVELCSFIDSNMISR
jgi:hypothetical protein